MKTLAPVLFLSLAQPSCAAALQDPLQPVPSATDVSAAAAPSQETAPPKKIPGEDRILWADEKHTNARFLPEEFIEATPLPTLPISKRSQEALLWYLRDNPNAPGVNASGIRAQCLWGRLLPEPFDQGPEARSLGSLARKSELALIGVVTKRETGWDAVYEKIVTRVDVLATEILKDEGSVLTPTKTISYLERGGSMLLKGVEVCSHDVTNLALEETGNSVLVLAFRVGGQSEFVEPGGLTFRIQAGEIQPKPIPGVSLQEALPITRFAEQLLVADGSKP